MTLFFLVVTLSLFGQVMALTQDEDTLFFVTNDTVEAGLIARRHLVSLFQAGHVFGGLDSGYVKNDTLFFQFHTGPNYEIRIREILGLEDFPDVSAVVGEPFIWIHETMEQMASTGYPFANAKVDSLLISGDVAYADLRLDPGPVIVYDTLEILSSIQTKASYLWRVLDLWPGQEYSETNFQNTPKKIRQIEYLTLRLPPDVAFSGGRAKVYLELDESRTNRFDGIIGMLPNQAQGNKPLITGFLDMKLGNLFRSGKELKLSWRRFDIQGQSMEVGYRHPYFLGSRMGLSGALGLLRQDSTFFTRALDLHIESVLSHYAILGFQYRNVLSQSIRNLSDESVGSFESNWYGVEISSLNKGPISELGTTLVFQFSFSLGSKKMNRQDSVNGQLVVPNVRIDGSYEAQLAIGRNALFTATRAAYLHNKQLLSNELDRVGGLSSLRGFNENQFFVSTYWVQQMEYRYFFEHRSFLTSFVDIANLSNEVAISPFQYWTFSFGAGMNLNSGNGIFKFIFAAGYHRDQPLDFQNTKIHFGYATVF